MKIQIFQLCWNSVSFPECAVQLFASLLGFSAWLHRAPLLQSSCFPTVGSWLIPGSGTLCPPGNPHGQFGAPLSLSPAHSCERYSSLRSHRPAPYASPYTHRNNSPSESEPAALGKGGWTQYVFQVSLKPRVWFCLFLPVPVVSVCLWKFHRRMDSNNKELSNLQIF